jgi:NADH:ubiquinone oxidoreductase subunit 4 (subunit M)
VGVDGIALSLIVMAAILTPICLLAAWNDLVRARGRTQARRSTTSP